MEIGILKERRKTVVAKDLNVPQGPSIKSQCCCCDLKCVRESESSSRAHDSFIAKLLL